MRILLILCCLLLGSLLWAQEEKSFHFDYFTLDDGLPNNRIHCILQDSEGWMWFGTSNGLSRFDGVNFKVYKHDRYNVETLGANLVRTIFEDSRNKLWVGLEHGGLCCYESGRELFTREPIPSENTLLSVNQVLEDKAGNLWLATSEGLMYKEFDSNEEKSIVNLHLNLRSPHIKNILIDSYSNIWLGTNKGLYLYNHKNKTVTPFEIPDTRYKADEIWALYEDSLGKIWIGTYNSGLYYMNPSEKKLIKSSFLPGVERSETVRSILEDENGVLWLGTRAGLYSYDGEKYTYYPLSADTEEFSSLNSILSLYKDKKGDLWIGSRHGVAYLVQEKQFVRSYGYSTQGGDYLNNGEVYAFLCDGNHLWIGTEQGGINLLDRKTEKYTYFTTENSALTSNCIKAFLRVKDYLWIGTFRGGINVMDMKTLKIVRHYLPSQNNASSISDNKIWSMFQDRNGHIWIGTGRGIDQYDETTDSFIHRQDILWDEQVNWINQDEDGDLWFGGENVLVIYTPTTKAIKKYYHKTRAFVEEPYGTYYVTTHDGIGLFKKENGFSRYYTEKDGLLNNYTHSILKGVNRTIWIASEGGLSLFDIENQTFRNFTKKDGLQNNQFNYGAFAITPQNELLFGGISGFSIIDPYKLKVNPYIPPVKITSVRLFNEELKPGRTKKPFLDNHIGKTEQIKLKHHQNMLTFSFIALNYVMPEKNRYRYRLEGLEEEWVEAENRNNVTYASLLPGKYVFHVQGANNDGIWNEGGARLEIIITPPFWMRWWFQLLLVGFCVGIIIFLVRAYLNRERIKNNLMLEKTKAKQLHEVDMMKLRFFTNISHEIRTPLTLITGPLEKLYNTSTEPEIKSQLEMVRKNAWKLKDMVEQLLDFRKLETGKYKVDYENDDIVSYFKSITDSFSDLAQEKNIKLTFESNQESYIAALDSQKTDKIFNNLISNALKYTPSGGQVNIILQIKEKEYTIIVKDTGVGIPAENLDKIFKRFFQYASNKNITGFGIGLSITHDLVEVLGGKITVDSDKDKGSTFIITLPLLNKAEKEKNTEFQPESIQHAKEEGNKKYMLVVEDSEDIREFIRTHFESDYHILEAKNGKEGLVMAIESIPDIILTDMLMPVMNGLEMCKKLKKDERTSHIPLLMLTAVTSREVELESLLAGADDYITKPFDIYILQAKVENLLSIRDSFRDKIKHDLLLRPSEIVVDSPDEKFLKKAVKVVEDYMDDPELDIEKFSEQMGVSRMQLYRKFEALTNMTVKEFIRSIRLKRAAQLLTQEKLTVSEIGWAVGFKDLSYFRKCFKEEFGLTPTDYIKKNTE